MRERIGKGEEEIDLPSSVVTVTDLLNHLKTLGEEYETALQYPEVIRVALDMARPTDTRSHCNAPKTI